MLADAYLPSMEQLLAAAPQRPARFRQDSYDFRSRDEALAWMLSTSTRQKSYHRNVFSIEEALSFPCHTWVLRPPQSVETPLREWFAGEPDDSELRITIQSTPTRFGNREIPDLSGYVYSGKKLGLQRKYFRRGPGRQIRLPSQLKISGSEFLDRFDQVHRNGAGVVDTFLASVGYDFIRSDGLYEVPTFS